MTLQQWVAWAVVPNEKKGSLSSWILARQCARDMGQPVDHTGFVAAMLAAGYVIKHRYGSACFFNCKDSPEKHSFMKRRYLWADDRLPHPLET
jgi:hypothetical protein